MKLDEWINQNLSGVGFRDSGGLAASIARAKLLEELAENVQEQRGVVTGIFPTDDQWDRSLVLGNRQREILAALKEG